MVRYRSVVDANHATWLAQAQAGFVGEVQDKSESYISGNFIIPAYMQAAEATQDGALLDKAIELVQAGIDKSGREEPHDLPAKKKRGDGLSAVPASAH